ncbi:MAG: capsule assembly Wzi family protein [Alcanivoracaceae bacterium]
MARFRLLVCQFLLLPVVAVASWWTPADDERLRHSIQWLADRGCVSIPVTTWPIAWADLALLDDAASACAGSAALTHVQRQRALATTAPSRVTLALSGATEPPLWRSFASSPREKAMVSAGVGKSGDRADVFFQISAADAGQNEARFDGSYLAVAAGNWALGVGAMDRWWGPGWHSALALSHNARPLPSLFLSRIESRRFDSVWLGWIGPWHASLFVAQLEQQRKPAGAQLIGMRWTARPVEGLEIGLSRTLQWAGEGRPRDFTTLFNALIGRDNVVSSGPGADDDPSDQMGGFDARYTLPFADRRISLYGQMIGEDEAGYLPTNFIAQYGVELGTALGAGQQRWFLEGSNTMAGGWFLRDSRPLVAYEHSIYETGFRYKGRNMGSTWERDAEVISLGLRQFFANGQDLATTVSHATLNEADAFRPGSLTPVPPLALAASRQQTAILAIRYGLPLGDSRITLAAHTMTDLIETATGKVDRYRVMASWEYRLASGAR